LILIVLAALCLVSVPLAGGQLTRMGEVPIRSAWLALVALGAQVLVMTIAPGANQAILASIHIVTYYLIGVFLYLNRHLPGSMVIAAGAGLNGYTIAMNGGVLPASAAAERVAGLSVGGGFNNSAVLAHPHLAFLGDIIPVPGPLPNVLSVGDLIVFAGMLVLLHRVCGGVRAAEPA
jgi:hypothetical protein